MAPGQALDKAWSIYGSAVKKLSAPDGHPDSIPTRQNIDATQGIVKSAVSLLAPAAKSGEMFTARNAGASIEAASKAIGLLTDLQSSMDQYSPPAGTAHQPELARKIDDIVDAIHRAEVPLGWE